MLRSTGNAKTGSAITVIINASPVLKAGGEIEAFQGSVEDVTERKSLAQQLWRSQKMEAIGRLAGGVAHDFNNVLMVVGSYAELIEQRAANDDKVSHYAGQIHQAATRAVSITRQLLAFSRQQILEPEILNLNDIVVELGKVLPRLSERTLSRHNARTRTQSDKSGSRSNGAGHREPGGQFSRRNAEGRPF